MKKLLTLFLIGTILFSPSVVLGAISRDASSQINAVGSWSDWNTTGTWAHTIAEANEILICGIETQGSAGDNDLLTSLTYNGTAMTQIVKRQRPDTTLVYNYLYYLLNPSTGTNNVVATVSVHQLYNYGACVSYKGVAQVAPEASGYVNGNGALTLTTIADNAWLVMFSIDGGGSTLTASTNTAEFNTIVNFGRMFDSNGAQTPAGSHSLLTTGGSSTYQISLGVSIAPAGASATPASFVNLFINGDW